MLVYDYIVIGAGAAGAVVAAGLSADANHRVLLLEEGPADNYPAIHIPGLLAYALRNPKLARHERTEPIPGLNDRRAAITRGTVLGGSTAVNGMMYIRGHAGDYDEWAALGNPGWSWREVLPLFDKSVDFRGADQRPIDARGPLPLSEISPTRASSNSYLQAVVNAGIARNSQMNRGDQLGVARVVGIQRRGRRWSTAKAFLAPARRRANLHIVTGAKACKIICENKRAVAVEYELADGARAIARCNREIISCAGTFGSAQLLQLSGIGNPDYLRAAGVEPLHALPGVGENFHDHVLVHVNGRFRHAGSSLNATLRSPLALAVQGLRWLLDGSGVLAMTASEIVSFVALRESVRPNLQLSFRPFVFAAGADGKPAIPAAPGFTISAIQLRPQSRGYLRLRSADPRERLLVQPNYLGEAADIDNIRDGIRLIRKIIATEPMRSLVEQELDPGSAIADDAALADYVRANAATVFHPVGSCKMGNDDMAVVDARLRVRGIDGLRVVDASIMPIIPSGNTMAPTIMIGEKAVQMILQDRQ